MNRNFAFSIIISIFIMIIISGVQLTEAQQQIQQEMDIQDTMLDGIRVNEVMFYPEEGEYEWVELKNYSDTPIDISGYGLTDEDGNWFQFPSNLSLVPSGAFVVIIFDGLGGKNDDLQFENNIALMHSKDGIIDIFEDEADQISLYSDVIQQNLYIPFVTKNYHIQSSFHHMDKLRSWNSSDNNEQDAPTILSFVAWGADPGEDDDAAVNSNIWISGTFVDASSSDSFEVSQIFLNETIGLLPGSQSIFAPYWTFYPKGEVTKGIENLVPTITSYFPYAGDTLDSESFIIYWNAIPNAVGYHFQLDNNEDFSSPEYELILEYAAFITQSLIPKGTYYWRAKTLFDVGESNWTDGINVNCISYLNNSKVTNQLNQEITQTLEIVPIQQMKDTNMLCFFGDEEGDGTTNDHTWDLPHIRTDAPQSLSHGVNYCSRAAISMLASYYDIHLSQDRIAFEDWALSASITTKYDLRDSLGHGKINDSSMSELLSTFQIEYFQIAANQATWENITEWIDNEQPMIAWVIQYGRHYEWTGLHFVVIDGYREIYNDEGVLQQQIHVLEPWVGEGLWPPLGEYQDYIHAIYLGEIVDNNTEIQGDEDLDSDGIPDTIDDSDGDGLCDFDEVYRFGLDKNNPDTDGDGVSDKADIRGYVFNDNGEHSLEFADYDEDGLRKEKDPDNDNDGAIDGCEDTNGDGHSDDPGETSNFNASDIKDCFWEEVGEASATNGGISNNDSWSRLPSISIGPDDIPYIVWQNDSTGGGQIYVRRWNGTYWEEVGFNSASEGGISNNSGNSKEPSIAIDPNGIPYVAWYDSDNGNWEIYVRRWNDITSNWEEVGESSASGGGISNSGYANSPSIAISPDGTPYVTWYDIDTSTGLNYRQIYVRRWNGFAWEEVGDGSASGDGISDTLGYSLFPSIDINPNGFPVIAWTDGSSGSQQIYVKRWNGNSWEPAGNNAASDGGISNTETVSQDPSIAISSSGISYIAWREELGDDHEIYIRQLIDGDDGEEWEEVGVGSATGGGISNNDHNSYRPRIVVDINNIPYIAWVNNSSEDSEIYVRHWNGTYWEEVGFHSASEGGISNDSHQSNYPDITVNSTGRPYVTWENRSGNVSIYMDIFVRRWMGE